MKQLFETHVQRLVLFLAVVMALLLPGPRARAVPQVPTGTIRGRVVHAGTLEPLPAANVMLGDGPLGTLTDADGAFVLPGIEAGTYRLQVRYLGFEPSVRTDVVVRPGRDTRVDFALTPTLLQGETVFVTGGYYTEDPAAPAGMITLNAEEIRRSPGAAGDVSRILHAMPSVNRAADNANDLMVRGGSPSENAFFIDGIQVPNINHFPGQGGTGGPIGFLNTDLIEDVTFRAGGFDARWGGRLSSVVDIRLREGDREQTVGQADLHFAGAGGVLEGPLPGSRGSWIVSARRSYLDAIITLFDQSGGLPVYGDVHAKAVLDLSESHRITLLDLYGYSGQTYDQAEATDAGLPEYGDSRTLQNTLGMTWRALWGPRGFSTTSLSWSATDGRYHRRSTYSGMETTQNDYLEQAIRLRSDHHFELGSRHRLDVGFGADREPARNAWSAAASTAPSGNPVTERSVDGTLRLWGASLYGTLSWQVDPSLSLTLGLRGSWNGPTLRRHTEPRGSVRLRLGERAALSLAAGVYHQRLPAFIIMQDGGYRGLEDPEACHLVIGWEYLLAPETRLSIEAYDKRYTHLPMVSSDPTRFVMDETSSQIGLSTYPDLSDIGQARACGIELLVQKRLAEDLYGLVSGTWFRTSYRDLDGVWRNRAYDNRLLLSVIGGYRPNRRWEMSIRFAVVGGRPLTPFDRSASESARTGILDAARIGAFRYPVYHALDLRVDRRFFFRSSNIVCYLSLWNAYDRMNIEQYYWNEVENRQAAMYQWGLLPILGVEWEF